CYASCLYCYGDFPLGLARISDPSYQTLPNFRAIYVLESQPPHAVGWLPQLLSQSSPVAHSQTHLSKVTMNTDRSTRQHGLGQRVVRSAFADLSTCPQHLTLADWLDAISSRAVVVWRSALETF